MNDPRRQPLVLVTAASEYGSTTEIARVIGLTLTDRQIEVDMVPPAAVDSVDDYAAVILGSAVYGGRWLTPARNFAIRFQAQLAAHPVWLFSTGPVGAASGKLVDSMDRDCADVTSIRQALPVRGHCIFAGKIDPQPLSAVQHASLLVHHLEPGDFRDWTAIRRWANDIADDVDRTAAAAEPSLSRSAARPRQEY